MWHFPYLCARYGIAQSMQRVIQWLALFLRRRRTTHSLHLQVHVHFSFFGSSDEEDSVSNLSSSMRIFIRFMRLRHLAPPYFLTFFCPSKSSSDPGWDILIISLQDDGISWMGILCTDVHRTYVDPWLPLLQRRYRRSLTLLQRNSFLKWQSTSRSLNAIWEHWQNFCRE